MKARYNDLLSPSTGGLGARRSLNGNHGEVDLRENFWGAAVDEMEAGGGFVDISGIHDFYDDVKRLALYAPWLTDTLPFAAGRDALVLSEEQIVVNAATGVYEGGHTWRGAPWHSTPVPSVELAVTAGFAHVDPRWPTSDVEAARARSCWSAEPTAT